MALVFICSVVSPSGALRSYDYFLTAYDYISARRCLPTQIGSRETVFLERLLCSALVDAAEYFLSLRQSAQHMTD